MTASEDGEVIGTSSGEVVVRRLRTDVAVRLNAGTLQGIAARLSGARDKHPAEHVYLALDAIRGTQDASTLSVYIELPENHGEYFAGTVGLYGLRLATVAAENASEKGLRFVLDVTPFFQGLDVAHAGSSEELVVSIRLRRELPERAAVVIGRLVVFRKVHGATA